MEVILINKGETQNRPPVISVLFILKKLGYKVTLITCVASPEFINMMKAENISIYVLPFNSRNSRIGKILDYLRFRHKSAVYIRKKNPEDFILWLADAPSIIAMGKSILKFNYILQIQELHETSKFQLNSISKVIGNAKAVFMPEYNRTFLYKIWFKLNKTPIVLPNKPHFLPSRIDLERLKEKHKDKILPLVNKKIILYQGGISRVRLLDRIAKAIMELDDSYTLLLVGKEQESGYINELKNIDSSIVHIPYLPAPDYLVFSTIAYIGYVFYEPISLNNIYCAPNKINEYSAYSLPMIGNDIPGLKTVFERTGAGVIVDENSIDSIKAGITEIDRNYNNYRSNASKVFEMHDNVKTIKNVLSDI